MSEDRFNASEAESDMLLNMLDNEAFEARVCAFIPPLQRRARRGRELRALGWRPSKTALVTWRGQDHAGVAERYGAVLPSEVEVVGLHILVSPDLALYLNGLGGFATAAPEERRAVAYLVARGVVAMHAVLAAWQVAGVETPTDRFHILDQMIRAYEEESR